MGPKEMPHSNLQNTVQEFPVPKAKVKHWTANQSESQERSQVENAVWKEVQDCNWAFSFTDLGCSRVLD